jgi:hypothetical protein
MIISFKIQQGLLPVIVAHFSRQHKIIKGRVLEASTKAGNGYSVPVNNMVYQLLDAVAVGMVYCYCLYGINIGKGIFKIDAYPAIAMLQVGKEFCNPVYFFVHRITIDR